MIRKFKRRGEKEKTHNNHPKKLTIGEVWMMDAMGQ